MKKTLLILLGVLMALPSLAHVPQYFKYTYEGQTYAFETTSDSTCMVRHIIGDSGSVIIPAVAKDVFDSYYDGVEFTVTALGSACFLDQKNIVSVEIPNSVTEVGESFLRLHRTYFDRDTQFSD